jgi:hypothetical protein
MDSEIFRGLLDQINSEPERALWTRWAQWYNTIGVQKFCVDGAGPTYFDQPVRILFALKDPNGWTDAAMQGQLAKGPERMWNAVARWGAIVYEALDPVAAGSVPNISRELKHLAAINLKKDTGTSGSDDKELSLSAHRDSEFLREQIRVLRPHVIVACGTQIPLAWLLGRQTPSIEHAPSKPYRTDDDGPWVIPWRHPAMSKRTDDDRLRESVMNLKAHM